MSNPAYIRVLRTFDQLLVVAPPHLNVLTGAAREVVEYTEYHVRLAENPNDNSAHYWLFHGQGSLLPDGLTRLLQSVHHMIAAPPER